MDVVIIGVLVVTIIASGLVIAGLLDQRKGDRVIIKNQSESLNSVTSENFRLAGELQDLKIQTAKTAKTDEADAFDPGEPFDPIHRIRDLHRRGMPWDN